MSTSLSFGPMPATDWLQLRAGTNPLTATPGPLPLLGLPLEARTTQDGVQAEILWLGLRLSVAGLAVGTGEIGPTQIGASDQQLLATVALAREALPLLLSPPPGRVLLTLRMTGLLRFRHHLDTSQLRPGAPTAGEWHLTPVPEQTMPELNIPVARSDWYDYVVKPLGLGSYLLAPLRLPTAEHAPPWASALSRLDDAGRALTSGDAAGAFGQCRGAIDALPGAKKNIFDAMRPGPPRDAVNKLTLAIGEYLHSGRHVAPNTAGEWEGEFPVDVDDALFAYNLTRLLLSHIAGLVLPPSGDS